jgi:phage protein D
MAAEGDVVLIYFEDKPLLFAKVEEILPDSKRAWYHVKLLMLQVPVHTVTWILRDSYINGTEFTMNGKKVRLERVVSPKDPEESEGEKKSPEAKDTGGAKVISFSDLKKK